MKAYGAHLVLAQTLAGGEHTVSYVQFDECEPGDEARQAEVRVRGDVSTAWS
ncbi:hypothetical protein [Nocardioides eburneiflavus]|uniref:hypothetical protein n=1 Tax=Nocardioides eburneiflavus TaxID=2518372 RepID=UPI00143DF975|nr:hypothetical protein [Nocardioides eburneiflavus]